MSIEIKYNYLKDLMDKIFRSEHLYDFVVEAGADRQKFKVHRNVIEASCTNFTMLLNRNKIILDWADGDMLQTAIEYIYSGHIELTINNVYDILTIASILGIHSLREKCIEFLNINLSLENCMDTLTIATKCDHFGLFHKTMKFVCERIVHVLFSSLSTFPLAQRIKRERDADPEGSVSDRISQCFELMATKHVELIPNVLKSIQLKYIPPEFLTDALETFYVKFDCTSTLLKEYRRRMIESATINSDVLTTWTPKQLYCICFSSSRKTLTVQQYNTISNSWNEFMTTMCVSSCVRYVCVNNKLCVIADQDYIRIVETYDLSSFDRTVCSRMMPWLSGFRPIAVSNYIYVLGGVGWYVDASSHLSVGSLERFDLEKGGKWETCERMPVQKYRYVSAELDERIYVAGGDSDGVFSDKFYCYDTKSDTWTEKASIRLGSTNAILFKAHQCLYVIDIALILYKYHPERDTWTMIGPFHVREMKIIHTVEYRDEIYAISKDGKFGIIEIDETGGHLNLLNEIPFNFDPSNPPMLFAN